LSILHFGTDLDNVIIFDNCKVICMLISCTQLVRFYSLFHVCMITEEKIWAVAFFIIIEGTKRLPNIWVFAFHERKNRKGKREHYRTTSSNPYVIREFAFVQPILMSAEFSCLVTILRIYIYHKHHQNVEQLCSYYSLFPSLVFKAWMFLFWKQQLFRL